MEGHYANRCRQRYECQGHTFETQLVKAVNTSCSISRHENSDWFLDTRASAHMPPTQSLLDHYASYTGKDCVIVGNGESLPITHTDKISHCPAFQLLNVLVVRHITKNILPTSKLTNGFPLSMTFTNNFFTIQNRQTGRAVATSKRDGNLYVLERGNSAFVYILKNKSHSDSYDLWHARLGHVNHSIISLLNKQGQLSLLSYCHLLHWVVLVKLQRVIVYHVLVLKDNLQK